ncbi:zinc ribbon domain-containing protein [Janibacter sp. GS2]|uniref:zinc ribbon domain-containing protein n=1 Tax=Janibacter sp. GS2 TaxID=3442646 RepID=UPI003EB8E7F1
MEATRQGGQVPTYTYSCRKCGSFDLLRTMAARDNPAPCPGCGGVGARVFVAPHLGGTDPALDRAATAAGSSAEAPRVTRAIPQAGRTPRGPARRPGYPLLPRP